MSNKINILIRGIDIMLFIYLLFVYYNYFIHLSYLK